MDSPESSPKKQRKMTLAVPEVSRDRLDAIQDRLTRWMRRDMWRLREGCDLAWHILPVRGIRQLYLSRIVDSENLCEWAERAVEAETLAAKRLDGPASEWWVRPADFCRWIAKQEHLIGLGRAAIFWNAIPRQAPTLPASNRLRVLESNYTTVHFDLVLSAINQFWIPWQQGELRLKPKKEEIERWLKQQHPAISDRTSSAIAAIIRPDDMTDEGKE